MSDTITMKIIISIFRKAMCHFVEQFSVIPILLPLIHCIPIPPDQSIILKFLKKMPMSLNSRKIQAYYIPICSFTPTQCGWKRQNFSENSLSAGKNPLEDSDFERFKCHLTLFDDNRNGVNISPDGVRGSNAGGS